MATPCAWVQYAETLACCCLRSRGQGCGDLYVAFNAHDYAVAPHLPGLPDGHKWVRVVDTNLPAPKDFTPDADKALEAGYNVMPFSSIMLKSMAA